MSSNDREKLGLRLREAREYLRLSQEEVSTLLGMSRSAISLAEGGKRRVDAIELQKFAKAYHKSIADLTGEIQEEPTIAGHLARAATGLTEKDQGELLEFARFLKTRANNRQDE